MKKKLSKEEFVELLTSYLEEKRREKEKEARRKYAKLQADLNGFEAGHYMRRHNSWRSRMKAKVKSEE